jgi:histidyl-tRNA synthetase
LHGSALVALDKLDKVGVDGVAAEFEARGIPAQAGALIETIRGFQANPAGMAGAFDGPGEQAWRNVAQIMYLTVGTSAATRIDLDLSLARGLSYYTGAIMEINVADLAGSLGGGGRYDNLVGMFLGQDIPACGFSLGLERILVVMGERGMFPPSLATTPADVMMAVFDPKDLDSAMRVAGLLRQAGLRVLTYPEPDKIGKQIKYADSRGIPYVAILGGDEITAGTVTIKNLAGKAQQTYDQASAGAAIFEELKRRG